jgi:hypothetical protein
VEEATSSALTSKPAQLDTTINTPRQASHPAVPIAVPSPRRRPRKLRGERDQRRSRADAEERAERVEEAVDALGRQR